MARGSRMVGHHITEEGVLVKSLVFYCRVLT